MDNKKIIMLHTLEYEAKQGEQHFSKIEKFVTKTEEFGRRRPSRINGWWKLDNGDWARREGAIFFKNSEGNWSEGKIVSNENDSNKIGMNPIKRDRENKMSKPAEEVFSE